MNLEWLRYFCAVVETGGFKQAARRVYRTQPAVSMGIRALEKSLGQALLDRRAGQPTTAGRLLYDRAKALLRQLDDLRRELADLGRAESMALRLGASDTTAIHLLPTLLRQFRDAFPDTTITMVSRSSDVIAALVAEGALDLGLVTLPESRDDLESRPLFAQRLALVASPPGWTDTPTPADGTRLTETPLILLDEQTRAGRVIREWLARHQVTQKPLLTCGSFEVIRQYIAEGLGSGFLPEDMVANQAQPIFQQRSLEEPPILTIGVVRRRDSYLTRRAHAFLEILEASSNPTLPMPRVTPTSTRRAARRHPR
ncbi:MAG TPA: LysR family transcriptional regulator [Candidatus Hydrogenedentes bacterium]|nr:LysR family transcriptional regulator [Candidatus Hydrogenedentota bacterium]